MSTFLDACKWLSEHPEMLRTEAAKIVERSFARVGKEVTYGRPRQVAGAKLKSWFGKIRQYKPQVNSDEQGRGEELLASCQKIFLDALEEEIKARTG